MLVPLFGFDGLFTLSPSGSPDPGRGQLRALISLVTVTDSRRDHYQIICT